MIAPSIITTPEAAFVAGLVTSLHCAGMCGPLACALLPVRTDPTAAAASYHGARLVAYGLLGALAGGLGRLPLALVPAPVLAALPWTAVVFFLALAFRWERWLPKPKGAAAAVFQATGRIRRRSPLGAAAAMGLGSPLLPCGPLYLLVALALLAGSALRGATLLVAFGLGTVPLLWLAQAQWGRLQRAISPEWTSRLRSILALAAALVAAWRLWRSPAAAAATHSSFVCF